jgi:hypothetical protein
MKAQAEYLCVKHRNPTSESPQGPGISLCSKSAVNGDRKKAGETEQEERENRLEDSKHIPLAYFTNSNIQESKVLRSFLQIVTRNLYLISIILRMV